VTEQKQAKRFYISGRVQGVGFRYFAQNSAEQLGIAGYVKNLSDGRVEVYAIGGTAQLQALARELRRGPRLAGVTEVNESQAELLPDFAFGFAVNYDY
jgi:acylphosphatase